MSKEDAAATKRIDELLPFLDDSGDEDDTGSTPRHGDQRLSVSAAGGIFIRERGVAVLARTCTDSVGGDARIEVGRDCERTTDGDATLDVKNGTDRLDVEGEASIEFRDRTLRMSGTIERHWSGPITRMAGMEGVICGGAYTKVHAGPVMTVAALATGDVYGACARFAGARVHVAGLHYRAAKVVMWNTGAYLRSAATVVEPLIGSPGAGGPAKSFAAKAARILKGVSAVVPFVDIAVGVLSLPVGIAMLIANKIRKKEEPPPSGPPRVRMRNGVRVSNTGLEIHT